MAACAFGGSLIPGQLVEDERADRGEEDDGDDRPDHLEPRRAVHLRAFGSPRALAAPVLDDEDDQRALDGHEDDAGEDRDDDERLVHVLTVRRVGPSGQEAGVACVRDRRRRKRDEAGYECGKGGPAHPAGIV